MDLQELRQKPHLSFSAISEYMNCGLKFKFSRIDQIQPEFTPDVLVYGRCVHRVLQEYNQHRLMGEIPPLTVLTGIFETLWDKALESTPVKYGKGKSPDTLRIEGKKLIETFYHERPEEYEILAIEEPFTIEMDHLPYPLIGAIDLIEQDSEGTVIITDYKTTAKAYSQAEIDQNMQLTLYEMALRNNGYANREIILKLDCLIKTREPKYEQYYTVRNSDDIKKLRNVIHAVYNGMAHEVYMPATANWMCINCAYQTHCEKWLKEML